MHTSCEDRNGFYKELLFTLVMGIFIGLFCLHMSAQDQARIEAKEHNE